MMKEINKLLLNAVQLHLLKLGGGSLQISDSFVLAGCHENKALLL